MRAKYVSILISILFLISCSKEIMTPTGEPVKIQISPQSASVRAGETKRFTVYAYDKNNNFVNITPQWSVEGDYGIINSAGIFYALPETPAPFPKTVYVVAKYGNLTDKVSVKILLPVLGVFTESYPELHYDRCPLSATNDHKAVIMMRWPPSPICCELSATYNPDEYTEGTRGLKIEITGDGGMAIKFAVFINCETKWKGGTYDNLGRDLSAYSNGKITFDVKCETANDFFIKIEENDNIDTDDYNKKFFEDILGIDPDNQWHHCEIPLNDIIPSLANGLTNISVPFGLHGANLGASSSNPIIVYLDNVLWVPAE